LNESEDGSVNNINEIKNEDFNNEEAQIGEKSFEVKKPLKFGDTQRQTDRPLIGAY
jgi:hypothetical protein